LSKTQTQIQNKKKSNVDREKSNAVLVHILGIFIGTISPLIFLKDKTSGFDYENARHVLNFKISMVIYWTFFWLLGLGIAVPLLYINPSFLILYGLLCLAIMMAIGIFELIVGIVGGVKASGGAVYKYPLEMSFKYRWNPFMLVPASFRKVKALLFPIKAGYWFKLGFVSLFSIYGYTSRGGNGNNIRIPSGGDSSGTSTNEVSKITGEAVSNLAGKGFIAGIVGFVVLLLALIALVFNYITSALTFVYVDALVNKGFKIKSSWKKNNYNAVSLFWFRIVVGLIHLCALVIIISLPILKILRTGGFETYFTDASFFPIFLDFLPYFVLLVIWGTIFTVFMTFAIDFSIIHTYKNSVGMSAAVKDMFRAVKNEKMQAYIYWYSKYLFSMVVGLIMAIASIVLILIPIIIYFILLFAILAAGGGALFTAYIIFGVLLLLFIIYIISVITLPVTTFLSYFSLLSYEKMFDTKLVNI